MSSHSALSSIIVKSKSMQDILATVTRVAAFNTTILIRGESGTGKELLASAIHQLSPRKSKKFVAINCGAIPENLIESELFGHKKGSFTDATRDTKGLFEEANHGVIFLDEIGELPLHLQVKILRALQERQIHRVGDEQPIDIDVRIIAATHSNLEEAIRIGTFRDDLYYRLNVVSIFIPPLRERLEDIPTLAEHFIQKTNKKLGLKIEGIDSEAARCLLKYPWRGNVRELENCIERAMVLTDSNKIEVDSLPENVRNAGDMKDSNFETVPLDDDNLSIKEHTCALETELILKALRKTHGNRTHAAKLLKISHRSLLYKLKEYGIN